MAKTKKKTFYATNPNDRINTGEIKIFFNRGIYETSDPKEQELLTNAGYSDKLPTVKKTTSESALRIMVAQLQAKICSLQKDLSISNDEVNSCKAKIASLEKQNKAPDKENKDEK